LKPNKRLKEKSKVSPTGGDLEGAKEEQLINIKSNPRHLADRV